MLRTFPTFQTSQLRPLIILGVVAIAVLLELAILIPDYGHAPTELAKRDENLQHVIEAGKAYNDLVNMLTTFGTGLFLLVALVARRKLLPTIRAAAGEVIIVLLFGLNITAAFYMAVHARFAVAHGILEHQLETGAIDTIIGRQALFTLLSGLCVAALIGEAFMTFTKTDAE